jgi:protein-S-isoprenylcysteine O-methyltransferase Ste14
MAENERDGAAVRIPPPLVYLGAVIAGVLLHAFVLPLRLVLAPGMRIAATAAAALLGLTAMGGAIRLFRRTGQDPKPWEPTPEIISTGVYRYTRNPMYVGMALLQIGIGVGLANGWILALVPLVLVLVYRTAIRHEEAYLERKFGETYASYKRSVRRWL